MIKNSLFIFLFLILLNSGCVSAEKKTETTVSKETENPNKGKISTLLKESLILIDKNQFSKACDKLNEVYLIAPYNKDADSVMKKLTKKMRMAGKKSGDTKKNEESSTGELKAVNQVQLLAKNNGEININKLETLKFDKLDFDNVKIENVFTKLEEKSRKKGVPLKFRFENLDFNVAHWPTISFKAENLKLIEALQAICKKLILEYEILDDCKTIVIREDVIM